MHKKLPNCKGAIIADAKIYNYLLNPLHPEGKSKAKFYELIGYTVESADLLKSDLLTLACSGVLVDEQVNRAGRKCVVIGGLKAPNGKEYQLQTVWAIEPPDDIPRLITAYPNHD